MSSALQGLEGAGKTRYLSEKAAAAVEARGPESVVIVSLTKAAAVEIAGRVNVPSDHVGTLHSICMHGGGLAGKPVLDSPKGYKLWNDWIGRKRPAWKLSGGTSADDPMSGLRDPTLGTEALERLCLLRHRMTPIQLWPESVLEFARAWQECMEELGATDFTGMIEAGLDMDRPPFAPSVLLADEVQDFSRLEGEVVRRWAENVETCVMAGDEDQTLYSWRGADPRVFSDNPPQRTIPLKQSHRVPVAVHALARRVIQGVRGRTDNPYLPTTEPGRVDFREDASWQRPQAWLDDVLRDSEKGGAMVLAPCAYALQPLLRLMREEGIPFHNPFRRNRGDWNPLGNRDSENRTAANQLLAFLAGEPESWHVEELKAWIPLLRGAKHRVPLLDDNAYLRWGVKAALERRHSHQAPFLTPSEYLDMFQEPEEAQAAFRRDLGWLVAGMAEKERDRTAFPLALLRKGGPELLRAEPKVVVGTIHSIKGAEGRHVYLLTALPNRWSEEQGDEVIRMMYVGITRARESITLLCGDRGGFQF